MYAKKDEGRDEAIVDPARRIIDPHIHLFERPPVRYLLADYLADANLGHDIVAAVYVETLAFARTDGPEDLRPVGEVEFANGLAAMSASGVYGKRRIGAGIVGYADLRLGDGVAQVLDASMAAAPERYRGVRQVLLDSPIEAPYRYMMVRPPKGILKTDQFREGFRHLAPRGLSFDAAVFHHQLPDLAKVASEFPGTTIVLNHMGMALGMEMSNEQRAEVFRDWRQNLFELARHSNVVCKVGGLGLLTWGIGLEKRPDPIGSPELAAIWKPYIDTAIEAFGPKRSMMESDFPPDGRSCGFVPLWNALKIIVSNYSEDEKNNMFHNTAARVYRLTEAQ